MAAIPKIGLGLGGLLLGSSEDGRIRIDELLEIPCSHTTGPSFALTPDEYAAAVRMSQQDRVVGWYLSRTRPPFTPDPALFDAICPHASRVLLLVRPAAMDATTLAVHYRNEGGEVVSGKERQLPEWLLAPGSAVVAAAKIAADEEVEPVGSYLPAPSPEMTLRNGSISILGPVPDGRMGFESIRSFKLVGPLRKKKAAATPPPNVEAPAGSLRVGIGKGGRKELIAPGGRWAEESPEPAGQIREPSAPPSPSDGGFASVRAARLDGPVPARSSAPHLPEASVPPEREAWKPLMPMPDGPVGFEPAVGIRFSGTPQPVRHEALREPAADIPLPMPDGPTGFQPATQVRMMQLSGAVPVPPLAHPAAEGSASGGTTIRTFGFSKAPPARVAPAAPKPAPDQSASSEPQSVRRHMFTEPEPARTAPVPPERPANAPQDVRQAEVAGAPGVNRDAGYTAVRSATLVPKTPMLPDAAPAVVSAPQAIGSVPRRTMPKWILWATTAAVLLFALVFGTRSLWMRVPLRLELSESNGHVTAIWNAENLPKGATGTLIINNGGQTTTVDLNATKVAEGVIGFERKAPGLSATLKVGDLTVLSQLQAPKQAPAFVPHGASDIKQ